MLQLPKNSTTNPYAPQIVESAAGPAEARAESLVVQHVEVEDSGDTNTVTSLNPLWGWLASWTLFMETTK